MAEGGSHNANRKPKKIQQICRYFIHGACDLGESCRFLHDRTRSVPANNICKYYQKGQCSYGRRCRYDHVRANQESNPSADPQIKTKRPQFESPSNPSRHLDVENRKSSMVTLKKGGFQEPAPVKKQDQNDRKKFEKKWVNAKDFIPGQKFHAGATYAKATEVEDEQDTPSLPNHPLPKDPKEEDLLCPYFAHGHCPFEPNCSYIHGEICDICQLPRLHPTDTVQREEHAKECLKEMEKDMELSFALQESKGKECCICLEVVLEKAEKEMSGAAMPRSSSDELFGILENCNHCFCLSCIRRWRSDKSFGKNVRTCPICRVHSDFVTPSNVWVEEEEQKKKVIQDYKDRLSLKPCRYFKQGKGECPFNEKCFYKHAYPDGTIAQPKPRKPRRRVDGNGEMSVMEAVSLWHFLERGEDGLISLEDELSMYLLGMLHDSDDEDFLFAGFSSDDTFDSDSDLYL